MKPLLIVANFKSQKIKSEAEKWINDAKKVLKSSDNKTIIVCPSFTLLDYFKSEVENNNLPIKLGAQDISRFPQGGHTGEVNGSQAKEFADYVLIGHSERRIFEDESVVEEKVRMAIDYGLTPILCIQNESDKIYRGVAIVAYEPHFAIGTGNADDPRNAENIAKKIKESKNVEKVLYGGSVTPDNVSSFTRTENIDGVLVGSGSLEFSEFYAIIENA